MKRLNITMPEEIEQHLRVVPNKSRFIAEALKEKFERDKRKKLDELLIEGYQATRQEDRRVNSGWEGATLEARS